MVRWLGILFGTLRGSVRTRRELALENLALRQQLAVWKARQPRPPLRATDRIFWVVLSRLWTNWRFAAGGAARNRGGMAPKGLQALLGVEGPTPKRSPRDQDGVARADLAMSRANPLWGAPRIHGELWHRRLGGSWRGGV